MKFSLEEPNRSIHALRFKGEPSSLEDCRGLYATLYRARGDGVVHLVADIAGLSQLDAQALSMLRTLKRSWISLGGETFLLCGLDANLSAFLSVLLTREFACFMDLEGALRALASWRSPGSLA